MKHKNLIIDAGAHTGEDTEFYLAKGFDVVAIEANPDLAERLFESFSSYITAGRLRVLNVAIAPESGTQSLAVADDMTIWSSLSPEFINRNEAVGTTYRYIDVPALRFEDVLADVGIPYYLKIDIEGLDMLCVEALHHFSERPSFVSLESQVTIGDSRLSQVLEELYYLWRLGYRRFQYVDQRNHPGVSLPKPAREGGFVDTTFSDGSTGPFGEELPGDWKSVVATVGRGWRLWLHQNLAGFGGRWSGRRATALFRALERRRGRSVGWYDLHARLGSVKDQ